MGSADHQDNRRLQLLQDFVDLHWLHVELALPPLPNAAGSHSFPIEVLPDKRAYQAYEKVLGQFIANFHEMDVEREEKIMDEGEIEDDDDETYLGRVVDVKGLGDLQPEVGLINWINELSDLVCQSP
jgi:protein regulator of cytokinesis 1